MENLFSSPPAQRSLLICSALCSLSSFVYSSSSSLHIKTLGALVAVALLPTLPWVSSSQPSCTSPPSPRASYLIRYVLSSPPRLVSLNKPFIAQYFQLCTDIGIRIRAGLVSCIYEKALVLSNDERANRPTGEVVNLMAVDTNRLQDLCSYGFMIISGPLQVCPSLCRVF
jgi:hypothetical protein